MIPIAAICIAGTATTGITARMEPPTELDRMGKIMVKGVAETRIVDCLVEGLGISANTALIGNRFPTAAKQTTMIWREVFRRKGTIIISMVTAVLTIREITQ
jgi:hypothetical protein